MKVKTLDPYLRPANAPIAKPPEYLGNVQADNMFEPHPYPENIQIQKGTFNTTLGGVLTLYDTTGGTKILTVDPDTGQVIISSGTISQILNLGTINSAIFTGTQTNSNVFSGGTYSGRHEGTTIGNINNATIGTPSLSAGTVNPSLYQAGGTSGVDGSIIYVKTVDFVGSTTTLGTVRFKSIVYSNA